MTFLSPNQRYQSTEGNMQEFIGSVQYTNTSVAIHRPTIHFTYIDTDPKT